MLKFLHSSKVAKIFGWTAGALASAAEAGALGKYGDLAKALAVLLGSLAVHAASNSGPVVK